MVFPFFERGSLSSGALCSLDLSHTSTPRYGGLEQILRLERYVLLLAGLDRVSSKSPDTPDMPQ